MTTLTQSRLVGYQVEPGVISRPALTGSAVINGELTEHVLTASARPPHPIDVGRDEHGDLVWVSHHVSENVDIPVLSDSPVLAMTFDPHQTRPLEEKEVRQERENLLHTLVASLSQRRLVVLASAVSGVILVFVGLGITSTSTNSTAAIQNTTPADVTSQQPDLSPEMEPTEAAIDFVLEGQVPGLSLPGGVSRDSLHATVVSSSGEIVLIDVQANQPEGLTTFATLLLQKSGNAWRIREVFDPR